MARDANGTYTLPTGINPVTSGDVITSAWANQSLDSIALALTNSLDRNGNGGMNVPLEFSDGNVTSPGITFVNNLTSGFYNTSSAGAATLDFRISVGGGDIMRFTETNNVRVAQVYDGASWQDLAIGTSSVAAGDLTNQTLAWNNTASAWQFNRVLMVDNVNTVAGINMGTDAGTGEINIPERDFQVNGYSLSNKLEIGLRISSSLTDPLYTPRALFQSIPDGGTYKVGQTTLLLGNDNPVIGFTTDYDAEASTPVGTTSIGFITDVNNNRRYPANAGNETSTLKYEAPKHTFWTSNGFGGFSKNLELSTAGRVSINVFNKIGNGAVSTRVNNAKLIVATSAQTAVIEPNTEHSILVTDASGTGAGGGGSIAFSSATNARTTPSAFGCIRGNFTNGNNNTSGTIDTYVRGTPTDSNMEIITRAKTSEFVVTKQLSLYTAYDPTNTGTKTLGIYSNGNHGFRYQALETAVDGGTGLVQPAVWGFAQLLFDFNAYKNGANPVTLGSYSDYRIKKEIGLLENAVNTIKLMRPITYTAKTETAQTENAKDVKQGFLAHEMQDIIPSIVLGEKDAVNAEGEYDLQSIYYAGLTPILVKAVQELTARIEALEA